MGKLTAISVRNAKPGRHADGEGLYLLVKPSGRKSWLLRVQVDGRRRDIGLGSVELSPRPGGDIIDIPLLHRRQLSLGEARDKSAVLRKAAYAGLDPKAERDKDRRGIPTFEAVARVCHEDLKGNWAPRQQGGQKEPADLVERTGGARQEGRKESLARIALGVTAPSGATIWSARLCALAKR